MRVLFVSGWDGDTRRYRCEHHQEQLALHGVDSVLRRLEVRSTHPLLYSDVLACDLLVLHRTGFTALVQDLVDLARIRGMPVIYETDDLVFDPAFFDAMGLVDSFSPQEAHRFSLDLKRQAETFQAADCVLTTTEALARACEARGKPAFVHRNAASLRMIETSEAVYAHRSTEDNGRVTLGYFSGSNSHNRDFAVITQPLLALMDRYPHVRLLIVGPLALDPALEVVAARIHHMPFLPWQDLPETIARVDVNLAPLEIENIFCQAKSEIKWMEAGLVGVPTVATPTGAFRHAIHHGQDGLLAATAEEWVDSLSGLVENRERRRSLGEAARRRVYSAYTPIVAGRQLVETLREIRERFAAQPGLAEDLALAVAERMQRYLVRCEKEYAELEQRLHALHNTYRSATRQSRQQQFDRQVHAEERLGQLQQQYTTTLQFILERLQRLKHPRGVS